MFLAKPTVQALFQADNHLTTAYFHAQRRQTGTSARTVHAKPILQSEQGAVDSALNVGLFSVEKLTGTPLQRRDSMRTTITVSKDRGRTAGDDLRDDRAASARNLTDPSRPVRKAEA